MEGATLADSLLDDLDDLSDGDEPQEREQEEEEDDDDDEANEESIPSTSQHERDISNTSTTTTATTNKTRKKRYLDSAGLQQHLDKIRQSTLLTGTSTKEQQQEEHLLIVASNKHLAALAEELTKAHGQAAECYKPKFPELEELLPNPIQYKNAVRAIGNELDIAKVSDDLQSILTSNQIITLSVAGSTTSGRQLNEQELEELNAALNYVEDIVQIQSELTQFVESRMESLAPSVCALVGPGVAAKLVGLAGGLAELSKIPSCNLQVLGQVKGNSASRAGLSNLNTRPHQGVLMECDLVQRVPKSMQRKVLKTVAAKLALAARCDFVNVDAGRTRSATSGTRFRDEIETKVQKWAEPDKAQTLKALPK